MNIIAYFSSNGEPSIGLTPTINVWKLDGTQVVTDENMTEIAGGGYYYDFTDYDEDEDYFIRADGGATLLSTDRYVYSTNETASIGNTLKFLKGNWKIYGNQLTIYDSDGTTELYKFNLKNREGTPSEVEVFRREGV